MAEVARWKGAMKKGDCCLLLLLRRCKKSLEINSAAKHHSDAASRFLRLMQPPHIIAASDRNSPHIAEEKKRRMENVERNSPKMREMIVSVLRKKQGIPFFGFVAGIFCAAVRIGEFRIRNLQATASAKSGSPKVKPEK